MRDRTLNRLMRYAGVALIAIGAIAFALVMFLFAGIARPWHVTGAGAIVATGISLLLAARRPEPGGQDDRGRAMILVIVFFTFGTLGPLLLLVFDRANVHLVSALLSLVISGAIATMWASAFVYRSFWILPLVILSQMFVPMRVFLLAGRLGLLSNFGELGEQTRAGIAALVSVVSLVLGYVLFVVYMRRVERSAARAEAELATAANIHSQLVPDLELSLAGWRLAGKSVPSAGMGGDLLDAVARDDGGLDVVLVDVSGHGTRAGVVMAVVKAAIRASLLSRESISQVAADANRVLCDVSPNDMFATACFVRTGAEGRVDMVVAGHPPALIAGPGGVRPVECEGSLPLGIRKSEAFEAVRLTLEQGESLVLYSDGVIEAGVNKLGIEDAFGDARLRAVVADACKSREPKPSAVNGAVFMSVEAHAPPEDDVSVLTLCRETA